MSCEAWKDRIALQVGGNLPATEAEELERHLHVCPICRDFAEDMAASQRALTRFDDWPRAEGSLARVRGGVLEKIAQGEAPNLRPFSPRPQPAVRWLALAASVLFAVFLWQGREQFAPREEPSPGEAQPPETLEGPPGDRPPGSSPPSHPPVPLATRGEAALPAPLPVPATVSPPSIRAAPRPEEATITRLPPSDGKRTDRWAPVVLSTTSEPLRSSSSLVVLPTTAELKQSSVALGGAPGVSMPGSVVRLELPAPTPGRPTLRLLSEHPDYAIYWLEEPADPLKEIEDANTKVL